MSAVTYEFPLNERIRNYLRVEHLMVKIRAAAQEQDGRHRGSFFAHLFTLLDLIERIDIRADVVKELDTQERNLVHWSQHPNIDDEALSTALQQVIRIREGLKSAKKPGSELKVDVFLQSIRQRFSIPGGTCSFDLPQLHHWLNQPLAQRDQALNKWLSHLQLLEEAISTSLSFLRQRGQFNALTATNGFYQGDPDDKSDLIRVRVAENANTYPTLSGNKYRFALRFMTLKGEQPASFDEDVTFEMATCR